MNERNDYGKCLTFRLLGVIAMAMSNGCLGQSNGGERVTGEGVPRTAPAAAGPGQMEVYRPDPYCWCYFTAVPGTTRLLLHSRAGPDALAEVLLWDYSTGRAVWRVAPKQANLPALFALSPDGSHFLFLDSPGKVVILWDRAANREVHRFTGHDDRINGIEWLPDGRRFVTSSQDGSAGVWDAECRDDENDLLHWFEGHEYRLSSLALSPDGGLAATGDEGGNVIVWDVGTRKTVRRFTPLLQKAWERGGYVRSFNTGEVMDPPGPRYYAIESLAFFPDGRRVAVGTSWFVEKRQALVLVLDIEGGREVARHVEKTEGGGIDRCLAVSPDGRRVLFSKGRGPVRLWDVQSRSVIANLSGHVSNRPDHEERRGKPGGILSVAFSPDGKQAISGGEDQTIRVWKLPD